LGDFSKNEKENGAFHDFHTIHFVEQLDERFSLQNFSMLGDIYNFLFLFMLTRTHFRHALPEPIAQEKQATQNFKK
jgi:hypothetical protein